MLFLGQASNYRARDIVRHTFAFGTKKDAVQLRAHLARRYGAKRSQVALYGTGRSALAAALKAVVPHPTQGQPEVFITALTCYAVVEAVRAAGCVPVFVDVEPQTLHFGAKQLSAALKAHPAATAVIVQNNLGHPVDMLSLEKVINKHHLVLIEDLAHCAGVRYPDGREAGTVGSAAMLSFGKGKSIDTISGGALILKSGAAPQPSLRPKLSNSLRARWYPFFGALIRGFYHIRLGRYFTSLLLKLHLIERSADAPLNLETRCSYWQAKLALRQLQQLPSSRPPLREFVLVENRSAVLAALEQKGYIFNDTWYDCPVAPQRYYQKSGFSSQECPVATRLAQEIVNLPLHYAAEKLTPARQIISEVGQ